MTSKTRTREQLDAKNARAREKRANRTPEQREADNAYWKNRYATDAAYRERKVAQNRVTNKKRKPPTREQLDARSSLQRKRYVEDAATREKIRADNKKRWRTKSYEQRLAHNLRQYGIGPGDYQRMLDEQGGVCAICKRPPTVDGPQRAKRLHVDHCHATGLVRGLLCSRCNFGIGLFDDDPAQIERAALYLKNAVGAPNAE